MTIEMGLPQNPSPEQIDEKMIHDLKCWTSFKRYAAEVLAVKEEHERMLENLGPN